jgi:hypothetical protein
VLDQRGHAHTRDLAREGLINSEESLPSAGPNTELVALRIRHDHPWLVLVVRNHDRTQLDKPTDLLRRRTASSHNKVQMDPVLAGLELTDRSYHDPAPRPRTLRVIHQPADGITREREQHTQREHSDR